ncbi:FecR family protein [Thermospira aquatica]|uniref:FecR domain-containing protein n=1 Tax=Thermospira aquatica TaxID=2828656 RepID=A0AAX3BCP2_9SPIR|nr:FecR family protein [Thermospira aquatica]URA10063.1 FecR domain-containing protein [Thermospira aquatica]
MKRAIIASFFLIGLLFGNTVKVGNFIGNCQYSLDGQNWQNVEYDMEIPVSAYVRVPANNDSLELILGDGSSIQLIGNTVLQVASIQKDASSKSMLKLVLGKLFAKIPKKKGVVLEIETETAVAAVRGTRFGVSFFPSEGGLVVVSEGSVEVVDPARTQTPKLLKAGEKLLLPATVAPLPNPQPASPEEIISFDEEYKPTETPQKEPSPPVQPTTPLPSPEPSPKKETPAPQPKKGGFSFDWALGGENIDGQIWNKIVLSPVLRLGGFGVGLYIPIYFISLDDFGYPSRWYNYNEWDFASPVDSLHDLFLKIRFLEYQNKWLFFRIGSLPNMTLGHGILINNYANDLEFPAVRKIGGQLNLDFQRAGFEILTGNAFSWDMAGARFFIRPFYGTAFIGRLGIGVSGFYDRIPVALYTNQQIVFGYGADIDLPVFEISEDLYMVLYSDIATLGYQDKELGMSTNMKGFGWASGLKGSLVVLDFRAEYRYLKEGFLMSYVDSFYDASRSQKYARLLFTESEDYSGFLLEAGKTFKGLGWVSMRYEHLFPLYETNLTVNMNTLHMEAGLEKGVIKWGYGSIAYDRVNFNLGDLFTSFPGEGSIVSAQVYYAVSPGAFLGIQFKRYYEIDPLTGALTAKDTFGITTQMGF